MEIISYTQEYIYVGSHISNSTIAHQVQSHIKSKQNHVRIFSSFVSKNEDVTYQVNEVVWESVLKVQYFIHVNVGCVKTSHQPLSHILLSDTSHRQIYLTNQIKSNQILFKVSNVHLKENKN